MLEGKAAGFGRIMLETKAMDKIKLVAEKKSPSTICRIAIGEMRQEN